MVKFYIQSPSVSIPPGFNVNIDAGHTVLELKQTIEREHFASPPANDMRIIWRGRILEDAEVIESLQGNSDTENLRYHQVVGANTLEETVVHFVLSTPMNITQSPICNKQNNSSSIIAKGKSSAVSYEATNAGNTERRKGLAKATLPVVPLGNRFQYVLMNGQPYLMELDPNNNGLDWSKEAKESTATAAGTDGPAQQQQNQHRNDRANDPGRAGGNAQIPPMIQQMWQNLRRQSMTRILWMVLRLLLVLFVLGHDASMKRVMVLAGIAGVYVAMRTAWLQQQLQRLNNWQQQTRQNGNEDEDEQQEEMREFTAWEKAKALIVALFATLVPEEPLNGAAAAGGANGN